MARLINNLDASMSPIIVNGFSMPSAGEGPIDPYLNEYLTIEILEDDSDLYFISTHLDAVRTIEYSLDKNEWTSVESKVIDISSLVFPDPIISGLNSGDKVYLRGDNDHYCINDNKGNGFLVAKIDSGINMKEFNLSGNIMSLIDSENFRTLKSFSNTEGYVFAGMFVGSSGDLGLYSKLISCENLRLPATTLTNSCYGSMFRGQVNLTTAPELPATKLAKGCYNEMFYGCTSLITAPELPATELAYGCYNEMFEGCTSLTTAPELPATTLANNCYQYMFSGCNSLESLTCLATDISVSNCIDNWLSGISTTGTLYVDPSMTSADWQVPQTWSVQAVQ